MFGIGMRKWLWIGHNLWEGMNLLGTNLWAGISKGAGWTGRPKQNWKRTVSKEPGKCGETYREVKRSGGSSLRWR